MTGGAYSCQLLTNTDIYCYNFSFLRLVMYRTLNYKKGTNKNEKKIQMMSNYDIYL